MSRPTLKMTKREKVRATDCTRAIVMMPSAIHATVDVGCPAAIASTACFKRYGTAIAMVPVARRQKSPNA